ncbi:MAG: RodZ domain-containing protein [Bryobacteraceae bacterium]
MSETRAGLAIPRIALLNVDQCSIILASASYPSGGASLYFSQLETEGRSAESKRVQASNMSSVGEILREERIRRGLEVGSIADSLCITKRYLDAIERNDLKSLPGAFFYRSFVKQYAAILELDEAVLAESIAGLLAEFEAPEPLPNPAPQYFAEVRSTRMRDPRAGDAIIVESNRRMLADRRIAIPAVALLVSLLGGGYVYERWTNRPSVAETAAKSQDAPVNPTVTAKRQDPDGGAVPAAYVPAAVSSDENSVRINVEATEKVWISITSDGKPIFSGILEPSESKSISGGEFAKVSVGNAGGLEIRWNGKSIGPIGKRGQVRTLKFTKDNFEILPPASQLGETL